MTDPTRRHLLKIGGTSAVVGIAGCTNNTDEGPDDEDTNSGNDTEDVDGNEDETNEGVSLSITDDHPQELRVENDTNESYEVVPIVIEIDSSNYFLNVFNLQAEESRAISIENPSDPPIENPRILQPPIGDEVEYYDGGGKSVGLTLNTANNTTPPKNSAFSFTDGIQATTTDSTGRFRISSDQHSISDPTQLRAYHIPPVAGTNAMELDEDGNIIIETSYVYWTQNLEFEVLSATESEEITASIPKPDVSIEFVDATVNENEIESLTIRVSANNEYYVPEARVIGIYNKFIQENPYTYFPRLGTIWSDDSGIEPFLQSRNNLPGYAPYDDSGDTYVGFIEEVVPYNSDIESGVSLSKQLISGNPENRVGTTEEYTLNSSALPYSVFDLPVEDDLTLTLYLQSGPTLLNKVSVNVVEDIF